MKRILNLILKTVLVAGIVVLFIFANKKQDQTTCPEFVIEMDYNSGDALVSRFYVRQLVTDAGIKVKGEKLGEIPMAQIHKAIEASPFVKKANLTMDVTGKVKALVIQRSPLVRIIDSKGSQFYLDTEGKKVPISHEYSSRVLVANGRIESSRENTQGALPSKNNEEYKKLSRDLQKIFVTSKSIKSDEFLNALIEQVHLNQSGELELIPKIGEQIILLGDTTQIKEKLEKLKIFYTMGNRTEAWSNYREINLKYQDQVVCKKSIK
jgi:cell division protein FtsQ